MNTIISALLLLSTLAALGHTAGINILPQDAAKDLKDCAWAAGWYAANIRAGYNGDAANDKANLRRHAENFKDKMAGIISSGTVKNIREMFEYSSWHTANTRVGYHSDARRDRDRVNSEYDAIRRSGELSSSLIRNIREMGWAAAWHGANTRAGYSDDARRDRRRFNDYFDDIRGNVELVGVNFMNDDFSVTQTAPNVVYRKRLPNCGSTQLQSECTYEESIGRTITYTHEVGFDYTITTGFSTGINFFGLGGDVNFEASFTFSSSFSFSESIERTTTRSYTFTLTAAPDTTNTGEATVQEATGSVPYELVFDFGGVRKTVPGTWTGVAVSTVIFQAREVEHTPCTR